MAKHFNTDMSVEEILTTMDSSGGNTECIHAGPCFLQFKLHQELINEQREANKESLKEQRKFQVEYLSKTNRLVWGTWALVGVTLLLTIITKQSGV